MNRALPSLPATLHRAIPAWRRVARVWRRHLGRPAWLALVLLALAALVQWQLQPSLRRDAARLEARRAALAASPLPGSVAGAPRGPLSVADIPSERQRGRDLETLVIAAQRAGLQMERADYSLGAATTGALTRVEATLPLSGNYSAVRRFVADVLNELPHAALESLQLERANAQARELQATARLVLFYSEETP